MIELQHLSYSIPEKDLYQDISLTIDEHAHYALIGSNGTGKSTLVDMILHPDNYLYEGKILFDEEYQNSRVGYVSQFSEEDPSSDMTVFEFISEEFVRLDRRIEELCEKMGQAEDLEAVFEEYQRALDEKEAIDGDHYELNIKRRLQLAGIENLEKQKLSSLSGGEFKLIQVIREMLLSPRIIFMDEPDVFLDFDHINALINLINSHKGTLLVITHSRYLLNHCFDHIIHLEGCKIAEFEGNYAEYQIELLTTKIDLEEAAAKDEAEIARQEAIVKKTRALATAFDSASLGRSLHARQTLLDRLKDQKTKLPFVEVKKPQLSFEVAHPLTLENDEGEVILSLRDYEASFGEQLLSHIDLDIKENDKVAIIGRNGTGKTTLLKDIVERQKASVHLHPEAEIALFSQEIGAFGSSKEKVCEVLDEAGLEIPSKMEEYLKKFGFREEALNKKLSMLSGGERDLLQLAVLSLKKANFLLLDEPTGHLDLYAQIALEEALSAYQGGVLMVSHDFYIVANCMDYVLFVEEQQIRKMSIRKFRQMVYKKHFAKEDLLLEDQKKNLEVRIEALLVQHDYEKARVLLEQLKEVVSEMK